MLPENFVQSLLGALIHVGNAIVKLLLLPFNLWVKAIVRLADQKERGLLNISSINGLWPFFSFCKRSTQAHSLHTHSVCYLLFTA